MKNILIKLLNQPGVSGYESAGGISDCIANLCKQIPNTNVEVDFLGNVLVSKGNGKKVIILESHLDEVGFLVTQIVSKDTLKVLPVGGIDPDLVTGSKVAISASDGSPVGILEDEFTVRIADSRSITIGDVCYFDRSNALGGDIITSPALDNRVSCAVLIELLKKPVAEGITLKFLFSTQHEQGSSLGFYELVKRLEPDFIFVLDAAYAQPYDVAGWSIPELGKGPAVQLMGNRFIVNGKVIELIKSVADKNNIPYQIEIPSKDKGGTDASKIPNSIPFAVINTPVSCQHTANSQANIKDCLETVKLVSELLKIIVPKNSL